MKTLKIVAPNMKMYDYIINNIFIFIYDSLIFVKKTIKSTIVNNYYSFTVYINYNN